MTTLPPERTPQTSNGELDDPPAQGLSHLPRGPRVLCGGVRVPFVVPGQHDEVWTQANGQEPWPETLDLPPAMRPGFNQKK